MMKIPRTGRAKRKQTNNVSISTYRTPRLKKIPDQLTLVCGIDTMQWHKRNLPEVSNIIAIEETKQKTRKLLHTFWVWLFAQTVWPL